jgi:hypothetical protein
VARLRDLSGLKNDTSEKSTATYHYWCLAAIQHQRMATLYLTVCSTSPALHYRTFKPSQKTFGVLMHLSKCGVSLSLSKKIPLIFILMGYHQEYFGDLIQETLIPGAENAREWG